MQVAKCLTMEDCEYLARNKLLNKETESLVSNTISDNVHAVESADMALMKWCQMNPEVANETNLYKFLLEMSNEGKYVKDAMLLLKPATSEY